MTDIGLFVIPIKFDNHTATYNDYIDFLADTEGRGYTHVYIGEHLTDSREDIQSSLIFASALAARTKKIKLCLSVLPLPHYNIKLLVKQLEDLYLLSSGRLSIGFSPGALKSDAEYLGFSHIERGQIFKSKITELFLEIDQSKFLSVIPRSEYFSTLLSPFPTNSSSLYDLGCSALTSNFSHPSLNASHRKCFTGSKPANQKWTKVFNVLPRDLAGLSQSSRTIVEQTFLYIYEKLGESNGQRIMLHETNVPTDRDLLGHLLIKSLSTTIDELREWQVAHSRNIFIGHPIVNLFDCLRDQAYTDLIFQIPPYVQHNS